MRYTQPLQFALLSLIIYTLLYRPPVDGNSQDFVTALMVFFTAMGWSGMILLTQHKKYRGLVIYIMLSIIGPILLYLLLAGFHPVLHGVTYAVFLAILLGLRLFTASYMRHTLK